MGFHGSTDTTVIAVPDTFYPIDTGWGGAGIVADHLVGMTFDSGLLTVVYAGHYLLSVSFSLTLSSGTNDVLEWDFALDGSAIGHSQKRYIANTSDIGSMGATGMHDITAGQTIGMVIKVDATDDLVVHGFQLTVVRLD
jgi:hypothetical protein